MDLLAQSGWEWVDQNELRLSTTSSQLLTVVEAVRDSAAIPESPVKRGRKRLRAMDRFAMAPTTGDHAGNFRSSVDSGNDPVPHPGLVLRPLHLAIFFGAVAIVFALTNRE